MIPPGSKDDAKLEALCASLLVQHKAELENPATKKVAEKKIAEELKRFISSMDFSATVDPVGPGLW